MKIMKGYIYLTKEFNSDGSELKHLDLTKIGIGKTNNLDRRFYIVALRIVIFFSMFFN